MGGISWKVFMVRPIQLYGKTNSYVLKYCDLCPFFITFAIASVGLGVVYQSKTKGHLLLLILCMVYLHGSL